MNGTEVIWGTVGGVFPIGSSGSASNEYGLGMNLKNGEVSQTDSCRRALQEEETENPKALGFHRGAPAWCEKSKQKVKGHESREVQEISYGWSLM